MAEVRAGRREGSVVSCLSTIEETPNEIWGQLSKELEDAGTTPDMIRIHQRYIKEWFSDALREGLLNEGPICILETQTAIRSEPDLVGDDHSPKPERGSAGCESSQTSRISHTSICLEVGSNLNTHEG